MQPNNTSPAAVSDPTNAFINDLGPGATATPVEDKKGAGGKPVQFGQIGKSGTYIFNGIITREEYNPDMQRWELLRNIDVMRRSDATVQALLEAVKLPILGIDWSIRPGSDEQQDVLIADFVRHCLFEWNIVFTDLLSEVLTFQDFGYSVFEKIWDYVNWQPNEYTPPKPEPKKDANGEPLPVDDPQPITPPAMKLIGLSDLQSRKQRSIYRWQTNGTTPGFGITQYVPGGTYSVPGEKLCIFTRKKEGENWEGISVLRASYKHWKIKDALELIEAIRHERQGLGVIEIVPPEGANEDDITDAIENARQARASEEAVIKHPKDWTVQFMDMKSGSTQLTDIGSTLEYHKREMLKSVLAQFLEIGSKGSAGTKSASQDHSQLFTQSLEFIAKYIGHVFNRSVIKELVDLNFTDVKSYPTLEHGKIADDDIAAMASAINQLGSAGFVTPDPEFEQWIRTLLHAPDLPDDIAEDYENHSIRNKPAPIIQMQGAPADPNSPQPVEPPVDESGATELSEEQTKTAADALEQARQAKKRLIDIVVR